MTNTTRQLSLAILLALFASYAGIAVHAASHVADDGGECEYCIAYGDSTDAADVAQLHVQPENDARHLPASTAAPLASRRTLPYRPRDPPRID